MSSYKKPYLLCEVANVHAGDSAYLKNLISEFKKVSYEKKGIKFQVFKSDRIALNDFEWFPVYEQLFFSPEQWSFFINEVSSAGDVWIDVFDTYGIEILVENINCVEGIKLQASILENHEVFEALSKVDFSEKKLMINISGFDIDRIALFVEKFEQVTKNLILQIGYQSYPTKISDTGLQKIPVLRAAFPNLEICIADHADATIDFALRAPIYGVLLGCQYIEKHICLSRDSTQYDKYSALEPLELEHLCQELHNLHQASTGKFIETAEREYLRKTIQIPVLKDNVKSASFLTPKDVVYRRTSQSGLTFDEIQTLQKERYVLNKPKNKYSTIVKADYKLANIAVIVACRMKSTRLPQKAILPILGVASVERCLEQCFEFHGISNVILATSDLPLDDELEKYNLDGKVKLWRGNPEDVIERYIGACDEYNVDVVIRVTADCPLMVPEIIEFLLEKHFESGADYTAAKDCAVGSSGEIINTTALKRVADYFGKAEYSEYMTWYFRNNSDVFKVNLVDLPNEYIRPYRMTLDYPKDLEFFEEFYNAYEIRFGNETKGVNNIFKVLDENPSIASINSHLTLKYKTDKELIKILNKETRIGNRSAL